MSAVLFIPFASMAKQNRYLSKSANQVEVNGQVVRGITRATADETLAGIERAKARGIALPEELSRLGARSAVLKAKGLI